MFEQLSTDIGVLNYKRDALEKSVVRVLIVDDFEAWRRYTSSALQKHPDFKIVGEASNGREAVQKTQELRPDLVLLDIALPKLNGIAAARRIHECAPNAKILFLSVERSCDMVEEALRCGASGYVVKADAAKDLFPAIKAILQGKQFVSAKATGDGHSDVAEEPDADDAGGEPSLAPLPPKRVEIRRRRKLC